MKRHQSSAAAIFKSSKWIWSSNAVWDLRNCYVLFRKEFDLQNLPNAAPIAITADQSYQLYINGRFVCRGPARGFQSSWPYDTVDLLPFLRIGKNVIAVRAHNPGFSNFSYIFQHFAGLLVAAQWDDVSLASDETWVCRHQTEVFKDAALSSIQLFPQEHFDARDHPEDWTAIDYDSKGWEAISGGRCWNAPPWFDLEERGIPMLCEEELPAGEIIGTAKGRCLDGYRTSKDTALLHYTESVSHEPCNAIDGSITVAEPTGEGNFFSYLIDFGHTVVGSMECEIEGGQGGEYIDIVYAESLDAGALKLALVFPHYCKIAFGSRIICAKSHTRHRFYHIYGFRYAALIVRSSKSALTLKVKLHRVGYPLERKAVFQSSDPTLNLIWNACVWTQQCCSIDAFIDTPWREQAQWWGDARVQARNVFYLSLDSALLRRGITQIASQQTPDGLTYGHSPTMAHNCVIPDFTLVWLLTLWDYYWQTGSLEPFLNHQYLIEKTLRYFESQLDPSTNLLRYDPRYYLFLDSSSILKKGFPCLYSLLFLNALQHLSKLSEVAFGGSPESWRLDELVHRVRTGLCRLMNKEGLISEGISPEGTMSGSVSVHSQTLAIATGLFPEFEQQMLAKVLVPYIKSIDCSETSPSAYWCTHVFELLIERGYRDEVLSFIKEAWLPMARYGTTWESFKPQPGQQSQSHAWSAHPLVHLHQILSGVTQRAVAWQEVHVRPTFYGDSFYGRIPTPQGDLTTEWQRHQGHIQFHLSLPEGVLAEVILPGVAPCRVRGSRSWQIKEEML